MKRNKRIVIVSGIQLSSNPRAQKDALALSEAGYDVEVLAAVLSPEFSEREQLLHQGKLWTYTAVIDNSKQSVRRRLKWTWLRCRRRLSGIAYRRFGFGAVGQLGYVAPEMLSICRQRRADLYVLHLEQAMWVGSKLLREGARVAVDMEDWYSEDLLPDDRATYPVRLLQECESYVLQNAAFATTTSQSLSHSLSRTFDVPEPKVVYNTFPSAHRLVQRKDRIDGDNCPSLFWFSQTIGPGRGLEQLADAMHFVKRDVEIHIRGTARAGFNSTLLERFPEHLRSRVHFHDQVSADELPGRIAEHDIGLAGELNYCKNKDLTVSNKIIQYLQGGLGVLASDTQGQREIADLARGAVLVYRMNQPQHLAEQLDLFLSDPTQLRDAKLAAAQSAKRHFNWQDAAATVVGLADDALGIENEMPLRCCG
jgi:glycosyltransferase involved in cell wall biosynthesis